MEADTTTHTPAVDVEVEVKRVERYACGCTSTRITTRTIEDKYRLLCATHHHSLASVVTSMHFQPVQPDVGEDGTE